MRTRVYVDGFNLYYGALKGTPFTGLPRSTAVGSLVLKKPQHPLTAKYYGP